jgi:Protein of unknown function (DUF1572)
MDVAQSTIDALKGAASIFLKDLNALPEEAFTKSFGLKVRTVADIVYEVNLVNDHVGTTIRGEVPFEWPHGDWIKAPVGFDNKATIIEAFEKSSQKAIETAESLSEADLESTVQTEHGEKTKFERCRFMALHMWYHSGQLNFVQTILGDDDWHW